MNGRSTTLALTQTRRAPWSESTPRRLSVALALSGLLHAAAFFSPYLGQSTRAAAPLAALRERFATPLEARLLPAQEPDAAARPQSSAAPRPAAARPRAQRRAEGIGLLPLAAPAYYATDQLSKRPQPLAAADVETPEIRAVVASGKMVLRLWIDPSGAVVEVDVEKSDLPAMFARTAIAAFKALRFTPGEIDGRPVGTLMRIEVSYDDGRAPRF